MKLILKKITSECRGRNNLFSTFLMRMIIYETQKIRSWSNNGLEAKFRILGAASKIDLQVRACMHVCLHVREETTTGSAIYILAVWLWESYLISLRLDFFTLWVLNVIISKKSLEHCWEHRKWEYKSKFLLWSRGYNWSDYSFHDHMYKLFLRIGY